MAIPEPSNDTPMGSFDWSSTKSLAVDQSLTNPGGGAEASEAAATAKASPPLVCQAVAGDCGEGPSKNRPYVPSGLRAPTAADAARAIQSRANACPSPSARSSIA